MGRMRPRNCEVCGSQYHPSHRVTRFCSTVCCGKSRIQAAPSKAASRKRAQRAIPVEWCKDCGATEGLQRHHEDLLRPLDVEVLCQACHTKRDVALGKWGKRRELTALEPLATRSCPHKRPTPCDYCCQKAVGE